MHDQRRVARVGDVAARRIAVRGQRRVDHRAGLGQLDGTLGVAEAQVHGQRRRAGQQAGVERHGEVEAGRQQDGDTIPAARAEVGRAGPGAGEQLGVGQRAVRRLHGEDAGARRRGALEPGLHQHGR